MSKKRAMKKKFIMQKLNIYPNGWVAKSELWEETDTTMANVKILQKMGVNGEPLCDDMEALKNHHADEVESVVNGWALFALTLIEACYNGDAALFRNIADTLRGERKHKRTKELTALMRAASKAGRYPTDLEVFEEAKELGNESGCQVLAELKTNLASQGYPIKSSRGRGRPKKHK